LQKQTDFATIAPKQREQIAGLLDKRPRKVFDGQLARAFEIGNENPIKRRCGHVTEGHHLWQGGLTLYRIG
jgi:hypothetical protein